MSAISYERDEQFYQAVIAGDTEQVQVLLTEGPIPVNLLQRSIADASLRGYIGIAQLLFQQPNANEVSPFTRGYTVMRASEQDRWDVVLELLPGASLTARQAELLRLRESDAMNDISILLQNHNPMLFLLK